MTFALELMRIGGRHLAIWLHPSEDDIPAHEWTSAIERILSYLARNGLEPADLCSLIVTDGATPNVKQRADLDRWVWDGGKAKTAVVSNALDNPIKRGVATAMSWLNPQIRFYEPSDFHSALAHLGLERASRAVWNALQALQDDMPHNASVWAIAQALEPTNAGLCPELGG